MKFVGQISVRSLVYSNSSPLEDGNIICRYWISVIIAGLSTTFFSPVFHAKFPIKYVHICISMYITWNIYIPLYLLVFLTSFSCKISYQICTYMYIYVYNMKYIYIPLYLLIYISYVLIYVCVHVDFLLIFQIFP